MIPSEKIFVDFYQYPVFALGNREDECMLGAFSSHGYPDDDPVWEANALEAAWRLGKSGVADIGEIKENDPFFLNLASTSSFHEESRWMSMILDPTELAVTLKEKYHLTEFGAFNPEFCKELCRIFEEKGVGFDVPCPYVPNWENQEKFPWPYPSHAVKK